MICYKDKTYCFRAPSCRNVQECGRLLTDDEKREAERRGLPIAWNLECEKYNPVTKDGF